jgi:outer membrane lipoprotein-sorting protein
MDYLDEYGRVIWIGSFWNSNPDYSCCKITWHMKLKTVSRNFKKYTWFDNEDYDLARQELTDTTRLEF